MGNYLDWAGKASAARWRYALAAVLGAGLMLLVLPTVYVIALAGIDPQFATSDIGVEFGFLPSAIAILLLVRLLLGRPAWTVALPA